MATKNLRTTTSILELEIEKCQSNKSLSNGAYDVPAEGEHQSTKFSQSKVLRESIQGFISLGKAIFSEEI
jgi:hypothetical protein